MGSNPVEVPKFFSALFATAYHLNFAEFNVTCIYILLTSQYKGTTYWHNVNMFMLCA